MAAEARKARLEVARRDREVAFRAALVELATNVQQVETWTPSLESTPPEKWHPLLSFAPMKDLLARVWIPGAHLGAEVTGNYAGILSLDGCVNRVGAESPVRLFPTSYPLPLVAHMVS